MLGFEAFYALFTSEACPREAFSTVHLLRKTTQGAYYFPQSGVEKIIVNMIDSDHSMRDTVFQVTGLWDAESKDGCGSILVI